VQVVAAETVGDRLPVGVVDVEQDHPVTTTDQLPGDLRAEAGGTAGDQGDLAHATPAAMPALSLPATGPEGWASPSMSNCAIRSRCCATSP
jgi:hypothetical protein